MKRVQCSVFREGDLCYLIAEKNAEGELEFWMQEPGEVRWYGYKPSEEERSAACGLLERGEINGWPLLTQPSIARK